VTPLVIYTDLDGSLLDHHDYSHAPADPLLRELEQLGVPVIPCTSKTRAELLQFRDELKNTHPFITENGAGVFVPEGYFSSQPRDTQSADGFWVKRFVKPRAHWIGLLNRLTDRFDGKFISFSQMQVSDIIRLTGLSREAALRAAEREFSEPVQWQGNNDQRQALVDALQQMGAHVLQGGRFLHVSGQCDKGTALNWLHSLYLEHNDAEPKASLAIGDSPNDISMLDTADYALVIRSPVQDPPALQRTQNLIISTHTGPEGWNEGVREILTRLKTSRR